MIRDEQKDVFNEKVYLHFMKMVVLAYKVFRNTASCVYKHNKHKCHVNSPSWNSRVCKRKLVCKVAQKLKLKLFKSKTVVFRDIFIYCASYSIVIHKFDDIVPPQLKD